MQSFTNPSNKIVQKLWGYEEIIVNRVDPGYCLKVLTVLPNGNACSVHYHRRKCETFIVMEGLLQLEIYDLLIGPQNVPGVEIESAWTLSGKMFLRAGEQTTLQPFTPHRFWTQDTVARFLEVSSYDDPADSYRLIESGPIPK